MVFYRRKNIIRTKAGKTFTRKQWSKVSKGELICENPFIAFSPIPHGPNTNPSVFLGFKRDMLVVLNLKTKQVIYDLPEYYIPMKFCKTRVKHNERRT